MEHIETLLDTLIEDLRITGEHPIPEWLKEPVEEPAILQDKEVHHDRDIDPVHSRQGLSS